MLEEQPATDPFLQRARLALLDDMGQGGPSLEGLAFRLHVSTRTLRRRLQEHGTSYRDLLDALDALRSELAQRYVRHGDHGFEEVTDRRGAPALAGGRLWGRQVGRCSPVPGLRAILDEC